jgi:polysaccharide export outer membrane protein
MKERIPRIGMVVVSLLALLATGCIGLVPSPFRPSPGPQKSPQIEDLAEAFDVVSRNYRIGPDDKLQVIYQTQWSIPEAYRLDTLDEIGVKFILDPQLNEQVVIAPDGYITLQGVGEVKAAGFTRAELARRIEEKFVQAKIFEPGAVGGELKNYKLVTVHLVKFYQKIQQLVNSLTTLVGGQQTTVLVKPDGTIDLPLLTDRILAAGHTVPQVERTANLLYRKGPLKHVVVSCSLSEARSRKIYVLGQVQQPGAYELKQPITALHAITMAGGHIPDTADLTSVILISKNIYGKPIGRRLDLKRVLDVGDMSSAILVKPYDVIYVPKTYIRDVRVFMEQYFRTVAEIGEFVDTLLDIQNKK